MSGDQNPSLIGEGSNSSQPQINQSRWSISQGETQMQDVLIDLKDKQPTGQKGRKNKAPAGKVKGDSKRPR